MCILARDFFFVLCIFFLPFEIFFFTTRYYYFLDGWMDGWMNWIGLDWIGLGGLGEKKNFDLT
jgi:hypothetical protein